MTLSSHIKVWLNAGLGRINLRVETRTAERAEAARLATLVAAGHFERPVFPVLRQFEDCDPGPILQTIEALSSDLKRLGQRTRFGYSLENSYFASPDAEVAYAVIVRWCPKRLVEVGSGNSTRLFRSAIKDAGLQTRLISIDPFPRRSIEGIAAEIFRQPLEQLPRTLFDELAAGDILFIDSSHLIGTGNDVVRLVLNIVPNLNPGVLVHFHDIFLPFEYPKEWVVNHRWGLTEQYLLQALLQGSDEFEVLWPGRYLQEIRPEIARLFDPRFYGVASSLWLRKLV